MRENEQGGDLANGCNMMVLYNTETTMTCNIGTPWIQKLHNTVYLW
jgi:hypothetical protein